MSAAAHYVEREYGYGYRIGLAIGGRVSVFEVAHSDGSRFNIAADCWGNVQRIPDDASAEQASAQISEMAKQASMV
jgi:hypothetical protein